MCDIVIIDEFLMVDIQLFKRVIDAVDFNTTKLLLIALSAKDLGISTATLEISGSSLDDWITDVKAYLEVKSYKSEKKKLDMLEKQLTALLSDDKQTELQIDSLAAMLE